MDKFLNLHPKGKIVGDCVKRAIVGAENRDYMEVQRELNRLKKETHCDCFNNRKNITAYMQKLLKLKQMEVALMRITNT